VLSSGHTLPLNLTGCSPWATDKPVEAPSPLSGILRVSFGFTQYDIRPRRGPSALTSGAWQSSVHLPRLRPPRLERQSSGFVSGRDGWVLLMSLPTPRQGDLGALASWEPPFSRDEGRLSPLEGRPTGPAGRNAGPRPDQLDWRRMPSKCPSRRFVRTPLRGNEAGKLS
jgi:hypothetical protein